MNNILRNAFSADDFRQQGHALIDMMADYLAGTTGTNDNEQVIPWESPEKQLNYWQQDFQRT